MNEPAFYATRYGRTYYEHQLPELLRQLAKLNENLEDLACAIRAEADKNENSKPEGERHDRDK